MSEKKQKKRTIPAPIDLAQRMAHTPREVAPMFGKSVTWVYRTLIYSGRVKVITSLGDTLIPRAELERLLSEAAIYEPETTSEPTDQPKNGGEA